MSEVEIGSGAFALLAAISVACGIGMLIVFRKFSDGAAIAVVKNRIIADLLEFQLFLDEPLIVLRAQGRVVVDNLRLMRLLLRPIFILTVPGILLFAQLDAMFGCAPVRPGRSTVITAQFDHAYPHPVLHSGADVAVETPPVHVTAAKQVSWRIRPLHAGTARIELVDAGRILNKTVTSGQTWAYVSPKRTESWSGFLLHPTEGRLSTGGVRWIEVSYAPATVLGLNWLIWFFAISGFTALLFRGRLRAL